MSDDTLGLVCGIDWATEHHDVAVIDDDGHVVARGRVSNDAPGFAALLTLLAQAGDSAADPIPVGIETDRGLWVAALRETGRTIYPINPLAASRYRARYGVSGAKSDATDAVLLANIVRTDPGAHRPLPADTELAQAIRVLARAQQDAVWARHGQRHQRPKRGRRNAPDTGHHPCRRLGAALHRRAARCAPVPAGARHPNLRGRRNRQSPCHQRDLRHLIL